MGLDHGMCLQRAYYAYRTHLGQSVCKVKSFFLNYVNSERLNMESMRDAMFNREDRDLSDAKSPQDLSGKIHSELYSREEIKEYSCVYTKRAVQWDLTTLPYGYY